MVDADVISKIEQLNNVFDKYKNTKDFSGVALIRKGKETLFQYETGYANRMYKIENTLTTSFDTASITKLFTAAGIVLLESRGQISFEDDIHGILDLQNTKISKNVKIKHLLTHTSGIADDAEEEKGEEYSDLFKDSPNYSLRENKDFLKNFVNKEPNFQPGADICYNNCAFILLGLAIEKITGMHFRDFITEEIFKPFHMEHTFFADKEDSDRPYAEGYFVDNQGKFKKNIYSFPPIGTADSGAYTTVEDLDTFMRIVCGSEVFQKMMKPQITIQKPRKDAWYTMGFGFELIVKDGEVIRVHKDGQNDGVCNITIYYPKEDITFTILGNVNCNIWELKSEAETILFGKDF